MVTLRFALLTLSLPLLGMYACAFRSVRLLALPGRIAIYFATGLLTIVAEMFMLSMAGLHWNAWLLIPLPLIASAVARFKQPPTANPSTPLRAGRQPPTPILAIALASWAILVSAVLAAMAAVLLAAGTKGKRFVLPNSRILIHQPMGGVQGPASEIEIHAREILRMRETLNIILKKHTGQSLDKIERDTDRDFIMTAAQSLEYGLVDHVIDKRV